MNSEPNANFDDIQDSEIHQEKKETHSRPKAAAKSFDLRQPSFCYSSSFSTKSAPVRKSMLRSTESTDLPHSLPRLR